MALLLLQLNFQDVAILRHFGREMDHISFPANYKTLLDIFFCLILIVSDETRPATIKPFSTFPFVYL